jgi:hypothetical protein
MWIRELVSKVLINPIIQNRTRHFCRAYQPTRDNKLIFTQKSIANFGNQSLCRAILLTRTRHWTPSRGKKLQPHPRIFFDTNSVIPPKRRSFSFRLPKIVYAYLISTAHYRYFANGERIELLRLSAYSTQQECKKPFSQFTHTDENADLTIVQYDWHVKQNRWPKLILFPQRITAK